jgi:hypothetical protein
MFVSLEGDKREGKEVQTMINRKRKMADLSHNI